MREGNLPTINRAGSLPSNTDRLRSPILTPACLLSSVLALFRSIEEKRRATDLLSLPRFVCREGKIAGARNFIITKFLSILCNVISRMFLSRIGRVERKMVIRLF